MIAVECDDEVSFLFVLMQKQSVKFDKVHIKNIRNVLSGTRWTHFITVRSPITEVSVRPSAERFSPLPSCCSETAYEEHGVGPEPHTHPLMVVIGGAVSH